MEKSIKRVENLVHVTNSALAQMKFSLMFDDVNGNGKFRGAKPFDPMFGEKFLDGDDLKRCQNEFKAEASDMLAKMESMFGSNEFCRKNAKAVDRIKEINRKMNHLRLVQSKPPEETEQSREKLLNLISDEKFSSGVTSSKDSVQSKNISFEHVKKPGEKPYSAPRRTESSLTIRKSPDKSKEELKSKILETQEIVNRGFETARQLAQKVETMSKCERKEKTPSTGKTVSEINLKSLEEKADSSETASNIKCRRRARERNKKRDDESINTRVIDVRRKEVEVCRRSNLQLQRLPSVHIKGGLQVQKIHNLEIPAGGDTSCVKSNTAINFLSHEQMENEKMGEMIEKVKRENCCCIDDDARGNYVECFNCGKWIKIRETRIDPRKVDEILQKCNFDVFDPRIDEFVEKIGTDVSMDWRERTQMTGPPVADRPCDPAPINSETTSNEITRKKKEERPKKDITLQTLSDQLLKKYKQEADNIESNHLKLDSILQNLFRQVDESREVFENCSFFRNKKSHFERGQKLTATKPVLINLGGTSFGIRKRQKKLEKRPMNYVIRCRSSAGEEKERYKGSACIKSVENEKPGGGITSLVCGSPSESSESERRKEVRGRLIPSPAGQSSSKRLTEMGRVEEGASSVTSSSTSRSLHRSKNIAGQEDTQSAIRSIQCRALKPSDQISRKEETERKSLESSILSRGKTSDSTEMRKEEIEREKVPSESLSSSSSKSRSRKTGQAAEREGDVEKPRAQLTPSFQSLVSEAAVMKSILTPSSNSDGKTISETSSDKSENNYESDFESMTNEPNEIGDECEEEEPEGNPCVNKLSTISEVDSELEKKLSDEQKTLRSSRNAEMDDTSGSCEMEARATTKREGGDVRCKQKKDDTVAVETSSESKKTEITPAKAAEISTKSTPTELVTSLKDILSALQDQFLRTESLAEKLTENAKVETAEKTDAGSLAFADDVVLYPWKMPTGAKLVENLRSARKDSNGGSKSQRRIIPPEKSVSERSKTSAEHKAFSADSLSEEGGSSLGEIIASDRRRKSTEKSDSTSISECSSLRLASARKSTLASERKESSIISAFKIDLNSEEAVYSEGEIPSDELFAYERFLKGSVEEPSVENNFVSSSAAN